MNKNMNIPLVSICCITYNHALYIRQCLDGFLMQKTNFAFEVLIHDDCSSDGTTEIIKEYEIQYPHIVKPLYEKENQWVKGRRGSAVFNFPRAKGKYIALCEGDDYWIDPYKLQKQVDFLEANPEYTLCFANAMEHWQDDDTKEDKPFSNVEDRDYSGVEVYKKWIVPTASILMRNTVLKSDIYAKARRNKNFIFGDNVLFLSCAHIGKIRGMADVVSVYRRCNRGAVIDTNRSPMRYLAFINQNIHIYKVFGDSYKEEAEKSFYSLSTALFLKMLRETEFKYAMMAFKLPLKYSVSKTIYYLYKHIKFHIKQAINSK